jgi:hypothetical protein
MLEGLILYQVQIDSVLTRCVRALDMDKNIQKAIEVQSENKLGTLGSLECGVRGRLMHSHFFPLR